MGLQRSGLGGDLWRSHSPFLTAGQHMAVHGSPLSDGGSTAALRSLFDRSSLEHQKVFPNV